MTYELLAKLIEEIRDIASEKTYPFIDDDTKRLKMIYEKIILAEKEVKNEGI